MADGGGGIVVRDGRREDEEALVALENASFSTDRLTRRSFRAFMASPTARLRIAGASRGMAGYALTLWRAGSGVARLYSIATDPALRGHGVAALLLRDAEEGAYAAGRAVMRLEVATANAAARMLYDRAGYRRIETLPGYYEDGSEALRLEKPLRAAAPAGAPAYYAQTTEFTCGAACLMMALRARRPDFPLDPITEVRLWRAATTVFMGTGLGGCEPQGMAVALAEAGLPVALWTSQPGPFMLRTLQNPEKRRVMALAQEDFRARIDALGVPVTVGTLTVARLAEWLAGGALAVLLISGNRMLGRQEPHWVLAWGADADHVFVHDPWIETDSWETEADAAAIPIPFAELDRMWRWGADRLRAAVILEPAA